MMIEEPSRDHLGRHYLFAGGSAVARDRDRRVRHPSVSGERRRRRYARALMAADSMTRGTFVGRASELAAVVSALCGEGRSVLVRGPRGIGVSRLVAEAVAVACRRGAVILEVPASRGARDVPYRALRSALPGSLPDEPIGRAQVAAAALMAIRDGHWRSVWVDDVGDLDDATAALLHRLVTDGEIVLVATLGDGPPPEPITALRVDDQVDVLALEPLAVDAVALLAESVLGGQVEADSARRLARSSGGVPARAIEIIDAGRRDGTLDRVRGLWCWQPSGVAMAAAISSAARPGGGTAALLDAAARASDDGEHVAARDLAAAADEQDRTNRSLQMLGDALLNTGSVDDLARAIEVHRLQVERAPSDAELVRALDGWQRALASLFSVDPAADHAAPAEALDAHLGDVATRLRSPAAADRVEAVRIRSDLVAAHPASALERGRALVSDPDRDLSARSDAAQALAPYLALMGAEAAAIACLEVGPDVVRDRDDGSGAAVRLALARARLELDRGDADAADRQVEAVRRLAVPRDPATVHAVGSLTAAVRLAQGRVLQALRLLREATALAHHYPTATVLAGDLALCAEAAVRARDDGLAREIADRAGALVSCAGGGDPGVVAAAMVATAWASAPDRRALELVRAAELASASGYQRAAQNAAWRSWLIEPTGRAMAIVLHETDPATTVPWHRAVIDQLLATQAGDGAAIDDVARRFAGWGRDLDAAIAASAAIGPHAGRGHRRLAVASATFAEESLARCGHPDPIAPLHEVRREPLSAREREVIGYLAEGWTNREIASRLHLSVRTVEGHVLKACTKLGARDRSHLVQILGEG